MCLLSSHWDTLFVLLKVTHFQFMRKQYFFFFFFLARSKRETASGKYLKKQQHTPKMHKCVSLHTMTNNHNMVEHEAIDRTSFFFALSTPNFNPPIGATPKHHRDPNRLLSFLANVTWQLVPEHIYKVLKRGGLLTPPPRPSRKIRSICQF